MSIIFLSNRRDFLRAVIGGAAGMTFAYRAYGQAAPQPITATKLSADLAVLAGDGGNVAIVIGPDGLMMIDGGLPNRVADLQKAITEVDAHKVRVLFNTHWHFDHTGSNETLGAAGAKIIAHENTKKWLSQKVTMEAFNRTFEPLKPEGIPTEVFSKGGKMSFGKEKIEYVHVAPAHTDSDAYVFLPGPNVLHTGDLLFSGFYPVIDYSTGGWIGGMVAAADAMLKVGDNKTRVVPGHGPLGTKDELKASRDMMHTVHERLETLSKQGKSVDEVLAAKPTKDLDEKWGKGLMNPENFVRVAYTSLSRHSQKA
jgi:cyclase